MDEGGEEDLRFRGGSEGEGDGDRGRLKRKGLVVLEGCWVGLVEGSSGAEAIARRLEWCERV